MVNSASLEGHRGISLGSVIPVGLGIFTMSYVVPAAPLDFQLHI